jgi:hypothetical protein
MESILELGGCWEIWLWLGGAQICYKVAAINTGVELNIQTRMAQTYRTCQSMGRKAEQLGNRSLWKMELFFFSIRFLWVQREQFQATEGTFELKARDAALRPCWWSWWRRRRRRRRLSLLNFLVRNFDFTIEIELNFPVRNFDFSFLWKVLPSWIFHVLMHLLDRISRFVGIW